MERWIECSAAEQRILEALWVRGSGTAADLAAAADVGERLASVCLTRLEQKGAVQRIERENGVVYAPPLRHRQYVLSWPALWLSQAEAAPKPTGALAAWRQGRKRF